MIAQSSKVMSRFLSLAVACLLLLGLAASATWADEVPEVEGEFEEGAPEGETEDAQSPTDEAEEAVRTELDRPLPRSSALSERGRAEVEAYERSLEVYAEEFRQFRETVNRVVQQEYARQRNVIQERFEGQITQARADELEQRLATIEEFEHFAARYPRSSYAPDVLFRLAQLYFEQAQYDYLQADAAFREEEQRFRLGLIAEEPPFPEKDLSQTIEIFNRLLTDFPDYEYADSARYLLAISHDDVGNPDQARMTFEELIALHPDSEYIQESWLRVGEYLFDDFNFPEAREAYTRSLDYGTSRWTDLALFKLGWTNYLLNQYGVALENFRELLVLYGDSDDVETASLLEEALQYYAIVIAERDWNLDGMTDEDYLLPRIENYLSGDEGYELQVIESLVEIFAELQPREEYLEHTAEVYEFAIRQFFEDPETPRRHFMVYSIYMMLDEEDRAVEVLSDLAVSYGPETEWFAVQERNGEIQAMAFAERLARLAMLESAAIAFLQGRQLREEAEETGDLELDRLSVERYRRSAQLYAEFLQAYPNDESVYESYYFRAQALMEARDYEDAVEQFRWVRDSRLSEEHQDQAAASVIEGLTNLLRLAVDAGELNPYVLPGQGLPSMPAFAGGELPEPEPLPPRVQELLEAYDRYLQLDVRDEDDPELQGQIAFEAARLFYLHDHVREARQRFVRMFDRYCGEPAAGFAALYLIQSYERAEDYRHMEYWANQVTERSECISLPGDDAERFAANIDAYRRNASFDNALRLREDGRFEAAAQEFVRIAEEYPDSVNGPEALYLAGDIYETDLRRYDQAMNQFQRLYERYPESEFVDGALLSLALNAELFFDFDRAVDTYRVLHRRGYVIEDPEMDLTEYPIRRAALLLEFKQEYGDAAAAYLEFVDAHPGDPRAPESMFRAARNLDRAGRGREMVDLVERFIRTHGSERGTGDFDVDDAVFEGLAMIVAHHRSRNDQRAARRVEDQILREFDARQPIPDLTESRSVAAQIAFERAIESAETWRQIRVGTSSRAQQQGIQAKRDGLTEVVQTFADVESLYRDPDVTMCARLQQGMIAQEMSDFIFDLPMPPEIEGNFDAEDMYLAQIEDIARTYEDIAINTWTELYQLIEEAGVVNDCTIDATRRLNRLRGDEFPLYKERIIPVGDRFVAPGHVEIPGAIEGRSTAPAAREALDRDLDSEDETEVETADPDSPEAEQ